MGKKMKIFIAFIVFAIIFFTSFFFARSISRDETSGRVLEYRGVFHFSWEKLPNGGRWRLFISPESSESFLLVNKLSPSFAGISDGQIVSSNDDRLFASEVFGDVVGMEAKTMSSYALFPEGYVMPSRMKVAFPLGGCGKVVQVDGVVERESIATHEESAGMLHAIDLKATMGSVVVAARAGRVVFVENRYPDVGGAGSRQDNRVIILHEDGTEAVYGHLKQGSVVVRVGDEVMTGQELAGVGNSGFSDRPHLHFHVGGLNSDGYHTLPLKFYFGEELVVPVVGRSYCHD